VTLTAVNISFAVLKILRLPLSELCTALFEGFAACGNFSGLENPGCGCITSWHQLTGVPSAPYENFTLACHSEECSDEESVFDFSVLVEKNAKQMLHGVYPEIAEGFSMTQQQTPTAPKDSFYLAGFAPLRETISPSLRPSRAMSLR
jgi:hypothetical protein